MTYILCGTAIGMTLSNFIYQAATKMDWNLAFERSFFQAVALVGAMLICRKKFGRWN